MQKEHTCNTASQRWVVTDQDNAMPAMSHQPAMMANRGDFRFARRSCRRPLAKVRHVQPSSPHCPSGNTADQFRPIARQAPRRKIFHFTEVRIYRTHETPWPETRGGSRSSRTAGWGAMDATASGVIGIAGRDTVTNGSRANDTTLTASSHGFGGEHTPPPGFPARTCADGEVVWSRRPGAVRQVLR